MRFFGRDRQADEPAGSGGGDGDEQALARYRYMLATAPPEQIEQAHEEAFARLTPDQRREARQALAQHVPASEVGGDDAASLARTATRAEVRRPGTIERAWGAQGGGVGLGSLFLYTLAGSFIGTAIAQSFFDNDPGASDTGDDSADAGEGGDGGYGGTDEAGGHMADTGGDFGGDFGGDLGGF